MSDSEGEIEYDEQDDVEEPALDGDEIDDDLIADEEDYESDDAAPAKDADDEDAEADTDAETEGPDEAASEIQSVGAPDAAASADARERARVTKTRAKSEAAQSQPGFFTIDERPGFGRAESENVEEIIIVPQDDRRCSHALSTFELTELKSVRAAEISKSGPSGAMVDIPPDITSAQEIAMYEIKMRRCPLKIMRAVGQDVVNGKVRKYVELWSPNEM